MSRVVLGRVLLAALMVTWVAGTAVADSKPAIKHVQKGAKKAGDKAKETDKAADAAKPAAKDKKPAASKDTAKSSDEKESSKPATVKVKKGPFRIEVSLDGIFEAQHQAEVVVRPQEWPLLTVLKAVEHGASVKQGDLVLALDTDKIDRTIAELRAELQLNELAVKQAEAQLAAMEKIAPLDIDSNERTKRMAEEDWNRYQEIEKPLAVKMNEYRLKAAQEQLDYAQEEYRQLEKMYKADDMTEDTEKIVLRRAKNGVDRAKFSMELSKASYDEAKKLLLPRQDEKAKEQTDRTMIDVDFTRASLPLLMSKNKLEMEKLNVASKEGEEKLKNLVADRAAMIVKAPIDGIVYYGRFSRGKWAVGSVDTLHRGAQVMPNEIIMTIVEPRPLVIRTTVPAVQFQRIRAGQKAYVEPVGFNDKKLTAIVEHVGTVPLGSSGFDCQLTVATDNLNPAIMPGMDCEMKLIPYKKMDALTIPPKTVFTDDFDPSRQYVYLLDKKGKPQKRDVTLGERNEKQVEVLSGLAAGDEILQEKPKED